MLFRLVTREGRVAGTLVRAVAPLTAPANRVKLFDQDITDVNAVAPGHDAMPFPKLVIPVIRTCPV